MRQIYELPIGFWRPVLGPGLHFHLGHFPDDRTELDASMIFAVENLALQANVPCRSRILDIGCGWGGPAGHLAKKFGASVVGLTISKSQQQWCNEVFQKSKLQIHVQVTDVEICSFRSLGSFDIIWLFEVLEHIQDRRSLLRKLHKLAGPDTRLAIAINCRNFDVSRELTSSSILGVQELETVSEVESLLNSTGWTIEQAIDRTELTLPVWQHWLMNLQSVPSAWRVHAAELEREFAILETMFCSGNLRSVQVVSRRII
jgi:cyclopropane fatty-acyl-phospholipid synthase-like methyltransferase